MCTKTNTTLLAWVFWVTYHRFIIKIKQTYSYLKAQLMTSIKWGAINSEVNSKYILVHIKNSDSIIDHAFIIRIIINIYIIKKHDPIHINKSNIYNISHAYGKLSTHLTQNKQHSQAETEGNLTDVLPVEYQDYLNTKETYSRMTRKNI